MGHNDIEALRDIAASPDEGHHFFSPVDGENSIRRRVRAETLRAQGPGDTSYSLAFGLCLIEKRLVTFREGVYLFDLLQ
jgi:hypothetical protein